MSGVTLKHQLLSWNTKFWQPIKIKFKFPDTFFSSLKDHMICMCMLKKQIIYPVMIWMKYIIYFQLVTQIHFSFLHDIKLSIVHNYTCLPHVIDNSSIKQYNLWSYLLFYKLIFIHIFSVLTCSNWYILLILIFIVTFSMKIYCLH